MRRIIICLVVLLIFSVTGVYAGAGHSHGPKTEITESQASAQAVQIVTDIIKKGKLDASWAQVQPAEVQRKTIKGSPEWVITINNPGEKDPAKQKLYIFLSLYGDYIAANHTGD